MSNSPEFKPVPAYEMLEIFYRPEEAQQLYDKMTFEEQNTVKEIMNLLHNRKIQLQNSSIDFTVKQSLPRVLSKNGLVVTPNIGEYLCFLGYTYQYICGPFPGELTDSVALVSW